MGGLFRRGRSDAQERVRCAVCGKEHPLATMVTRHKDPEDVPASARGEFPPPHDWWLEDAEAAHEQHPRSFFIPPAHRRRALRVGDLVRLGFNYGPHADREREGHRERMWVEVLEQREDGHAHGRLRNRPSRLAEIEIGDRVAFEPLHVLGIDYSDEELGYAQEQWPVVDEALLADDRAPDFVIRAPGPYTADQDEWWLLCRAGPSSPTIEGVGRLTDLFPGLDEPLRAGAGVWELAEGERASARWRCVPEHELAASDEWQNLLRRLETTAHAMAGREALAAADWAKARACLERARDFGESAEVLDGLSVAVHFQGEYDLAIELKERAYACYRRGGMRVEAAELARWLAFLHGAVHGNMAAANGWMARAESLLEGVEECAAHGWLTLDRAPWSHDSSERERLARAALAIARRFGDTDLEFGSLALLGDAYVHSGRLAEGMTLLDEAMAAVTGGEVAGVATVGEIYCRLLGACERAADVSRAQQWMSAAADYVAWGDFVPPTCRLHYGGILIATGRWAEAEEELLAAIRTFDAGYRAMRLSPLLRLAELRVLQGRFEEAERLLEGNESHAVARRLRATIALARGDLALAEELARVCLEGHDPSDPGCAPLLELLVDVQLAQKDPGAAAETRDRLTDLATKSRDGPLAGRAEFAAGRVLAAEGDVRASSELQTALERFSGLGLPHAAARAQLELARTLVIRAPDAAVAEASLALGTFERLGAGSDADAAGDLLRRLGATGRAWPRRYGALTKRETEVLSLLAAGCSNAEIGERLYISRRTAEHHVASILAKLGLRSRAEAAAYAVREPPKAP